MGLVHPIRDMTDIERFKTYLYHLLEKVGATGYVEFQQVLRENPLQNPAYSFSEYLKKEERLHPSAPGSYRETIHRAVVQRFNKIKNWKCKDPVELYHKISDRLEANAIVNSMKIRDPAVGSGRFLVAALHELICMKNQLDILHDHTGQPLMDYRVEVVKDELIVKDINGKVFRYNPASRESQLVQQTFFHEKQTLISNCLSGVGDNPRLVEICRLRLWIELLKNAYFLENPPEESNASPVCYLNSGELREGYKPQPVLVPLPEIVNIRCGSFPH